MRATCTAAVSRPGLRMTQPPSTMVAEMFDAAIDEL
jgi:hypothetical protein